MALLETVRQSVSARKMAQVLKSRFVRKPESEVPPFILQLSGVQAARVFPSPHDANKPRRLSSTEVLN
jgi:hypothetical protein